MELCRPAHVRQATGALLDRLEPELVAVEGARSLKVPGRELGNHRMRVAQRSGHGVLSFGDRKGLRTRLDDGSQPIAVMHHDGGTVSRSTSEWSSTSPSAYGRH